MNTETEQKRIVKLLQASSEEVENLQVEVVEMEARHKQEREEIERRLSLKRSKMHSLVSMLES